MLNNNVEINSDMMHKYDFYANKKVFEKV